MYHAYSRLMLLGRRLVRQRYLGLTTGGGGGGNVSPVLACVRCSWGVCVENSLDCALVLTIGNDAASLSRHNQKALFRNSYYVSGASVEKHITPFVQDRVFR